MHLDSQLLNCTITHIRKKPKPHQFRHRHFMFYVDLEDVAKLDSTMNLVGTVFGRPYRFEQTDHIPDPVHIYSLEQRLMHMAASHGVTKQIKRIKLLTNLRFLEYVFNPVSFFLCFDDHKQPVCCVVEVGNTFGEKKPYFIPAAPDGTFKSRQQKLFYVSPFTELEQEFDFDIRVDKDRVHIRIDTYEGDEVVVASLMTGTLSPLSDWHLVSNTLRHPFAPMQVITLIHWHAFMLWLKRVPFREKEYKPDRQTKVILPNLWRKRINRKVAPAHATD